MRWGPLLLVAACSYEPAGAQPDATNVAPIDAFAVASCPGDYSLIGPASRYRVITEGRQAWIHSDDCNDDLLGATHLVAIDDLPELDRVQAAVDATGSIANNKAWIGAVQPRDQGARGAGWISTTGIAVPLPLWDQNEPNDAGAVEDNSENWAGLERGRTGMIDFATGDNFGAVCECDGKPLAAEARAAIEENRL